MDDLYPGNVVVLSNGYQYGLVVACHYPRVGVAFSTHDLPVLPAENYLFSFQVTKIANSVAEAYNYLDQNTLYNLLETEQGVGMARQFLVDY